MRIRVAPVEQRTYKGTIYASKAEAIRAAELDLLLRAGVLKSWKHQPVFELGCPENKYTADFWCEPSDPNVPVWVEEIKGHETRSWKRNKRLWRVYGPCQLRVMYRSRNGWSTKIVEGKAMR